MRIFIDGDASPVQDLVIELAASFDLPVLMIKSYAHFSYRQLPSFVEELYVDSEPEAADLAIVNRVQKGDIVITQDYGLASLCLAKGATSIHHKGFVFTEKNIDRLLQSRHENAKARRAGQRTKGPKALTEEDRKKFTSVLREQVQLFKS